MTKNGENFDEVVQGVNIPIIIAGGSKKDNFNDLLQTVEKCVLAGASGIAIGRNVFQSDNPELAIKKIRETVITAFEETGKNETLLR